MSPVSKSQQKSVNKYIKINYDRINLTLPKGKKEEIQAAAEGAETAAEDEAKTQAAGLAVFQIKPMTLKGKVTLNKQNLGMFAGMMLQGDEGKLAKLNQLIDFVNSLDYTLLYDGVDAEGFVSAKGEDLASFLALRSDDSLSVYSDVFPSYYVDFKQEDLQGMTAQFQLPADVDPAKLMEAVSTPLMKLLGGIRFGEAEAVEETLLDTVFTSKTPIDMTLKEMALLGLNTVKEIAENEEVSKLLAGLKDKGVNISVEGIDQAIANVEAAKDEEMPAMDAGIYTNEQNDSVFKVDVIQDGQIVSHSVGGQIGDSGVSEVQVGDKVYVNAKAGKEGMNLVVRAQGMEFGIDVVPEKRANGKAVTATLSLMKMEMAKIEVEKLNDGILTGKFNIDGRKEITLKDLQEKKEEMANDVAKDVKVNYLPALKEKIQKIAPEMLPIFSSLKKLLKNAAQTMPAQFMPALPQ